jgi:Asp-tRNA(Asn)/Glu-tRNA(Gln) amidotransferase A subunit family amidase
MADAALVTMTIAELAPKIKSKAISPVELTEAVLTQVDRLQPHLNSFITILHEPARRQAREQEAALMRGEYRGPLHGIPIGIKDNIATAGIRTTVGSKVFTDYVPEEDAYVVNRCKEAGAIIIGKENLEEFAAGSTSNNLHYGAVHNPWNLEHIPGGSSGGGGANVAACVTFASLGTDLGGSVRGPANFCGVVGLKQTYGRVSQRGLMVTSFNGDHIGPITRSVQDSALMLQVIAGYDPLDPSTVPVPVPDYSALLGQELRGLKMGIPSNYYFGVVDPDVVRDPRRPGPTTLDLVAQLDERQLAASHLLGQSTPLLRVLDLHKLVGVRQAVLAQRHQFADLRRGVGQAKPVLEIALVLAELVGQLADAVPMFVDHAVVHRRFVERRQVLALEVLDDRDLEGGVVVDVLDQGGDRLEAGQA